MRKEKGNIFLFLFSARSVRALGAPVSRSQLPSVKYVYAVDYKSMIGGRPLRENILPFVIIIEIITLSQDMCLTPSLCSHLIAPDDIKHEKETLIGS